MLPNSFSLTAFMAVGVAFQRINASLCALHYRVRKCKPAWPAKGKHFIRKSQLQGDDSGDISKAASSQRRVATSGILGMTEGVVG